ncbi:bifunctional diaminohydroxyphosphoribosylaminopyrimidine deaminase/5-amino-6-(5-phosphoribosylamino)uracil reductase RibD [Vibrio sp. SCSIO 43137]|uniref:bifunctional diaminohydroxyphosphoribosylaminopyrimidine deaminase/5-amino-6-(5-phosphoribosylamino)uracil reductase RibD n=1 Tax=Vibrio sp. SCSIO 43137 TaxID=3021011 RepID=UPI0023077FC9|nr:bifunctional diaminohydroxyphosphoribosylaminopyrimidine deaminase/5-amino-6-(5-phosphoribosylamino)uracil reductase RibD [Vibrio sp. SCSIO 43137]WCE30379.1 bifunctional diaminohydroxyphosphoribosylaminopyrimidine deaminase/5-amino-6-(5-phosphoribosylamino)uracil reductase RibD [Vibrio sp. SCSIO 43137]
MSSKFSAFDIEMMSRALKLAKKGRYTTAPNPMVGCVITKDEQIIGEGYHYQSGQPHAEVFALRQAQEKAEGATAYVTLEPCSHYGRTPPCAEALVKAKVAKVICAMQDPNPQVAGRGIKILREAGIEVEVGLLESDSEALNPAFIKTMKTGKPFVQLKLAASLDGQTALSNGQSQWITSIEARKDVQRFRAMSGAILSSSKTVTDDNASLNVRWDDLPASVQMEYPQQNLRQPLRVILDRQHQLDPSLKLFRCDGKILTVSDTAPADIKGSADSEGRLELAPLLDTMCGEHNINHIWVEAGATLAAGFIKQNLVDELIIYLAPKLMGADGRSLINLLGLESMDQVIDLEIKDMRMVGKDIRLIAAIKKN